MGGEKIQRLIPSLAFCLPGGMCVPLNSNFSSRAVNVGLMCLHVVSFYSMLNYGRVLLPDSNLLYFLLLALELCLMWEGGNRFFSTRNSLGIQID